MGSIRDYFDQDFGPAAKLAISLMGETSRGIEAKILFDFASLAAYQAFFIPGADKTLEFFSKVLTENPPGTGVHFGGKIELPQIRAFPADLEVYNYSPSLANVKALDWNLLGEEEVWRLLYNAIM